MTPSTETLWAYAKGELSADEAAQVKAELGRSAQAREALADVEASLQVLSLLPEAPPMPDALSRRVANALADEVDGIASKTFTSWWQVLLGPRFFLAGLAAAALALGLVWWQQRHEPKPSDDVVAVPHRPFAPVEVPVPFERRPVVATVASVRKAASNSGVLKVAQRLETGSSVTTDEGGSLWLKLPDGTKAGLTGATNVKLARLDERELTLDIERGSLAMVVPHREDRVLTVRAGEVEVVDLGTRFLVSRELAKVVVAVEEGSVEVRTPRSTQVVKAGHAVAWHDGELDDYAWKTAQPSMTTPPPPPSVEKLPEVKLPEPELPVVADEDSEPEAANPEDEWATPASEAFAGSAPPPPPVDAPPGSVVTEHPAAVAPAVLPRRRRNTGFNLKAIEDNLRELQRQAHVPFGSPREVQARAVRNFADSGDCHEAIEAADVWLAGPSADAFDEAPLRRIVLQQKVRCLNHLKRYAEAAELQRLLDR